MPLTDLIKRLERAKQEIESEFPQKVLQAGSVLVKDISMRLVTKGVDYKGEKFSSYSTKPMLTSGITTKSQTVGNRYWKKKDTKWRTILSRGRMVHLFILDGGYKELRQIEDLQVTHKDFKFTGMMWNQFGVKRFTKNSFTIGGTTDTSQKKIDGNSQREGRSIIKPSQKELEKQRLRLKKWLHDKIYS